MSGFRTKNTSKTKAAKPKVAPAAEQDKDEVLGQEDQHEEDLESAEEEEGDESDSDDGSEESSGEGEVPVAPVASAPVAAPLPKKQPNVRIKPNQEINTYIGDKWYRLKKDTETNVPEHVKEILARAGALHVL